MKPISEILPRRNFLRRVLWGGAMSGTLPLASTAASGTPVRPLATRRMDEMTSREVEFYLKEGGDLVFIPFGPISGHGAFIPMGMHAHWANALSMLAAERANGLVFPATFCAFAGATRTFRGTVSFPVEEQVSVLKRIASSLQEAGFRRTVLVAGTTPENTGGIIAARSLFDNTEKPFLFVEAARLLEAPEVKAIYEGYPGNFGETLIELASLRILGRERPVPLANWAKELKKEDDSDQPAEIADDIKAMRRVGAVGWRYYEEKNHGNHGTAGLTFRERSDIDMAVEALHKCADALLPALARFGHYASWLSEHPAAKIQATDRIDEK
jgi:hypothetical protein